MASLGVRLMRKEIEMPKHSARRAGVPSAATLLVGGVAALILSGCALAPKQTVQGPPASQPAGVQQAAGGVVTQLQGDIAAIKTVQNFSVWLLAVLIIMCIGLGYLAIWTSHRRGMRRIGNGAK